MIQEGVGKENGAEFLTLLAHLEEDLQPQGIRQWILGERIAIYQWRLRRVLRCEVGEIRNDLDRAQKSDSLNQFTTPSDRISEDTEIQLEVSGDK